ncbi:MAG: hypothetical protein IJ435_03750 [Clostridia bacterium]|nr:hypothetical protein [Clostridia bacterium]
MITNRTVTINTSIYKAYVFKQNKLKADDMGEKFDCKVTVRVPIVRNQKINVEIGDCIFVDGTQWKVVGVTCNRTGYNPHYHIVGAR